MEKTILILILSSVIICSYCQVHYVPIAIAIPSLNASVYNATQNSTNSFFNNNSYYNNATYSNPDGHIIVGNIHYLDRLLFNQVFFKARRWWSSRELTVQYPRDVPGGYVRHETISAIRVYNQFYDGHNSNARIVSGGVGRKFVTIQLQSSWRRGFKYLIQIFGH